MQTSTIAGNISMWKECYPHLAHMVRETEGKESKWFRLDCKWVEIQQSQNQYIHHRYSFLVDSEKNELFLDCGKAKIFLKMALSILARPLHTLAKTAYHMCLPLSCFYEGKRAYFATYAKAKANQDEKNFRNNEEYSKLFKRIFAQRIKNSLMDIYRTPYYGTILTIIGIASLIIAPFSPTALYEMRSLAGRIEIKMLWNEERDPWNLYPCFQPILLDDIRERYSYVKEDTFYESNSVTIQALSNYARSIIQWQRKNKSIFNNCYRLLPSDKAYTSPAWSA